MAKHGNKSVTENANNLQLQLQLNHYPEFHMNCTADAALLKFIERDHLYDFLAGLNVEVRIQILGMDGMPLKEANPIVQAHKQYKECYARTSKIEGVELVTKQEQKPNERTDTPNKLSNPKSQANDNHQARQIREKCWKLNR